MHYYCNNSFKTEDAHLYLYETLKQDMNNFIDYYNFFYQKKECSLMKDLATNNSMTKQSFLRILQYNIRKSLKIQESFLIDREVREFDIVAIQKQGRNNNDLQSFSSAHNFFHLVKNSSSQSRTCIYVNKCLRLNQ